MLSDAQRLDRVVELVQNGFCDKVLLSHDIHTKHRLVCMVIKGPHTISKLEFLKIFFFIISLLLSINLLSLQVNFGGHGFSHIINNVIPKMLIKDMDEETINKITKENPKTWLSWSVK